MRTAALLFGGLALACSAQGATSPGPASLVEPALVETSADEIEPADDPIGELETILVRIDIEHPNAHASRIGAFLGDAGITEGLAIRALATCTGAVSSSRCLDAERAELVAQWLGDHGSMRAASVLVARGSTGLFAAQYALEKILARQMLADAGPCAPPTTSDIARAREDLAGFAVIDAMGADLVARAPTERELDDLAYFTAAVRLAGPEIEQHKPAFRSGIVPEPKELEERAAWLAEMAEARKAGDLATVQARGYAYIQSLGYPGEIDHSREGEMTWGGARASQLMREVAQTSEILGELDVAAALYSRANPGGGACGTSTGYRWSQQVEGFIRTRERAEGCRAVVAERLLDIDGQWNGESPYGPWRLVEAGFDLARLYRGALVTRNRDLDPATVLSAIDRAPPELGAAARTRWANRGPEAWEWRVRAIEGLADELDREGVELLLAQHLSFGPPARARALTAIGEAGARLFVGPCDDDAIALGGMSIGGGWERPVGMFGTTCATRLSDADATAMTKRLRPQLDAGDPDVRAAALAAIGQLAAPRSLAMLRRQLAAANVEVRRCEAATPDDCYPQTNVRDAAQQAVEHLGHLLAER